MYETFSNIVLQLCSAKKLKYIFYVKKFPTNWHNVGFFLVFYDTNKCDAFCIFVLNITVPSVTEKIKVCYKIKKQFLIPVTFLFLLYTE